MAKLTIPRELIVRIESHARAEAPRECCGMLGGRRSQITGCYPLRNLSHTPETSYFAAPEDIFVAMRSMREAEEELLAIYHSHPQGDAYPSQTDVELAFYPGVFHIVLSLSQNFELRAFRISNKLVETVQNIN